MRVVVIWREESDYGRDVRDWLREFEHRIGKTPECYSPDEGEGLSMCKSYDIVEYPTIIAIDSTGRVQQVWRGRQLPTFDDVQFYMIEQ